ncbi:MAG: hypothetical protein GF401_14305 [Chitinivibrionales bacterium]|nr:hypothetical protein [Chitinivibrionales bacterium]
MRHTIKNDLIVQSTQIHPGPVRCAVISPQGNELAYIKKDGSLCIAGIYGSGKEIVLLENLPENSWIDWPHKNWIYYTTVDDCSKLKRIQTYLKSKESVAQFPYRVSQFSMTSELSHGSVVVLHNDEWHAAVFELEDGKASIFNERPGMGGEISPDGSFFAHNQDGYTITRVRRSDDATIVNEWGIRKANVAGSSWGVMRWATNSNDWLTITQGARVGAPRDSVVLFQNQMVYKKDGSETIQVTANSPIEGGFDEAGDLWLGDPDILLKKKAFLRLEEIPPTLDDRHNKNDELLATTIKPVNAGAPGSTLPNLEARADAPWLTTQILGKGTDQNVVCIVNKAKAPFNKQTAQVTLWGEGCDTLIFPITYTAEDGLVFSSLKIEPDLVAVNPGNPLQFRALPCDRNGDIIDIEPSIEWTLDGDGKIDSTGLFTADSSVGEITISASATINGTTRTGILKTSVQYPSLKANVGGGLVDGKWLDASPFISGGIEVESNKEYNTTRVFAPGPHAIYKSARKGAMTITFPSSLVPDGHYKLRLHCIETFGDRSSATIIVENDTVFTSSQNEATIQGQADIRIIETDAMVDDGNGLEIRFIPVSGKEPGISGIEILDHHLYNSAVTLLSPNGNERFRVGDQVTVRWSADADAVDSVELLLSLDDGRQWIPIGENSTGHADRIPSHKDSYTWAIPLELQGIPIACSHCQLMVRHPEALALDRSDESFSIYSLSQTAVDNDPELVDQSFGIHIHSPDNIAVSVPFDGLFNIDIVGIDGSVVSKIKAFGPQDYLLTSNDLTSGIYLVRVSAHNRQASRIVMIGN